MSKKNCWEFKDCGRGPGSENPCVACLDECAGGINGGQAGGRACWVVAGTMCGGTEQGKFSTKLNNCLECDFFNRVRQEEGADFRMGVDLVLQHGQTEELRSSYYKLLDSVMESRTLAAEVSENRRLAAIGTLAAGVAHEINTPAQFTSDSIAFAKEAIQDLFSIVEGYQEIVEALKRGEEATNRIQQLDRDVEVADLDFLIQELPQALQRGSDGIERIAKIVRAMKEFGHPGTNERTAVDLNRSLKNTLIVARSEYKYLADVETEYGQVPEVMGNEVELNQVFLNLVVNAAHAIAEKIEAGGADRGTIKIKTWAEEEAVLVSICDDGCGIPDGIRSKIFNPFFTTKEVGKGTGQGLAFTWSTIVETHGGSIELESSVGQGAKFTLRLPLSGTTTA